MQVAGSPFSGVYGTGDAQREMLFYLCRSNQLISTSMRKQINSYTHVVDSCGSG
jgi:hypothetical protein